MGGRAVPQDYTKRSQPPCRPLVTSPRPMRREACSRARRHSSDDARSGGISEAEYGRTSVRGAARLTAPLADRRRGGREEPTNGRARRERSVIAGRTARPGGGGACPTHRWAVVMLGSGSEVARGEDPARDLSVSSSLPQGTAGRAWEAVGGRVNHFVFRSNSGV